MDWVVCYKTQTGKKKSVILSGPDEDSVLLIFQRLFPRATVLLIMEDE
jgi:hypothetical protein